MTTDLKKLPAQIEARIPEIVTEAPWTRAVAAGSLLAGVYFLFTGRRKAALAAAVAGAAVAALEKPEVLREIWENAPKHLRTGQDFLLKAEDVMVDLKNRGEKLREMLSKT
jgi:aminoglycoside phosphotransferase